jgi:hypothetical protein
LTFWLDEVALVNSHSGDFMDMYYEECPSHDLALERLHQVLIEEGIAADIKVIRVETEEQAEELHFVGSPTILVNGEDIVLPPSNAYYALTCRAYMLEDGRISPLPSSEMIRRSVRNAVKSLRNANP